MKSKWLQEVELMCSNQGSGADAWNTIEDTLKKIDDLLYRAMFDTDSNGLFDDIRKIMNG